MSFAEMVKERYSMRKFDGRPVEKEKLDAILEAGRLAPTACNFQPQRILVIQGEDLKRMEECTRMQFGQSVMLVVCWDSTVSWKNRMGRDVGIVDSAIVLTQMMYQAQELGVGSLIVGVYKEDLLRERFHIPGHYEIGCMLMLGCPAEDCQPHPKLHNNRRPLEETVSYGSF